MSHLAITEIKAFVPALDFATSKQFYRDLGFTMASEGGGIAYFHREQASFLLQDCGDEPEMRQHAECFAMHMLVADVDAWRAHVLSTDVVARYGISLSELRTQPWRMRDFCLKDPSGVSWIIGQNV